MGLASLLPAASAGLRWLATCRIGFAALMLFLDRVLGECLERVKGIEPSS
jgi:hypothetical protein